MTALFPQTQARLERDLAEHKRQIAEAADRIDRALARFRKWEASQ